MFGPLLRHQSSCSSSIAVVAASQLRAFATSTPRASKIGQMPITLPPSVRLTRIPPPPSKGRTQALATLEVDGPLGSLSLPLPPHLTVTLDETGTKAKVRPDDPFEPRQRALWGATRARLQNHVTGVSEGHVAILRLVGVGYRASVEGGGRTVNLKVQYAHAIELAVPEGVTATTPQPTRIQLHGADKAVVMQFAAQIREWRKPEPYKGKGIFVNNETIRLKQRKIK